MKKPVSIFGGRWTLDVSPSRCRCGEDVYPLRRGRLVRLPPGHHCPARKIQDDVIRTVRLEEEAGLRVTEGQAADRLRDFGVGDAALVVRS